MYAWLSTSLYNSIPSQVKNVIKEVDKNYTQAGGSRPTVTAPMKVFTPALSEITGSEYSSSYLNVGSKYSIFEDSENKIKHIGNTPERYWTRSLDNSGSVTAMYTNSSGNPAYDYNYAGGQYGVCFGFCV